MTRLFSPVRNYPLTSFFLLALALTWIAFLPWAASNGDGIPWFTFGPMVAAFTVAAITSGWTGVRDILARMGRWRVHLVWYLVAIGLPFGAQYVSILINPLFGSAAPEWGNIPALAQILPMVAILAVFSGPLGEEPGWRGFAMPRLMESHSALIASLVIGVVWTVWHLPLYFVDDLSLYGSLTTVLAAFVFTWVYQNTNGSVLIAMLMHVAHQNSVRYLGKVFVDGDHLQQQWIGTGIWVLIVAGILAVYGTRSFANGSRTARPQHQLV